MDPQRFDNLSKRFARQASRRSVLRGLGGGLLAGVVSIGRRNQDASAGATITICHATGNPDTPYEPMTVGRAEFNLHARHGDFMRLECCADSECPNQYGLCGVGVCQNGYCTQLPVAAGTSCDDGTYCNGEAICDGAFNCVPGAGVRCSPSDNPCTANVCDEASHGCIEVPANEGGACSDGDSCTADICLSGVCVSTPNPVDCVVSAWSEWGACSAECGGGTQTRTRTIVTEASCGGAGCPSLIETQACNEQVCPITCGSGACIPEGACIDGECFTVYPHCDAAYSVVVNGGGVNACICGPGSEAPCSTTGDCNTGEICLIIGGRNKCTLGCSAYVSP